MSTSENSKNPSLDLSGLDFGPSWAKKDSPKKDYSKETGPREGRPQKRGGGGPRRGQERGDSRGNHRSGGGDRRHSQGGGNRNDSRGRRPYDDRRPPREETPAPEGFHAHLMPVEEGLDNLSREIQASGRTYSVFDLAKIVTGARERFNVNFLAPKGQKFYRCRLDNSLWLTKEEALRQLWRGQLVKEFYEEVIIETEAPSGNFSSVAKCGLSGEYLGPPNYHSYQSAVTQLHRERFGHLSLENYKRKICVESGEEAVNAWLEQMKKQVRYRPLTTEEIVTRRQELKEKEAQQALKSKKAPENPAPKSDDSAESSPSPESVNETAEPSSEPAPDNNTASEIETSSIEESPATENPENTDTAKAEPAAETPKEEAAPDAEPELIADRRDLERHFAENHFKSTFAEVEKAWVPGNIPAKQLSPGLLTLLKAIVAEERRYPAKLTPLLCRQLSGRHLAVFKWQKKLKAGPARPHAIPHDISLAERPQKLLDWLEANSGKNLEELWQNTLPADADDRVKRGYYHDLHWILNQGYVLLMADGTLHLTKGRATVEDAATAKPSSKEEGKKEMISENPEPDAPTPEKAQQASRENAPPTATEKTTNPEPASNDQAKPSAVAPESESPQT